MVIVQSERNDCSSGNKGPFLAFQPDINIPKETYIPLQVLILL